MTDLIITTTQVVCSALMQEKSDAKFTCRGHKSVSTTRLRRTWRVSELPIQQTMAQFKPQYWWLMVLLNYYCEMHVLRVRT